MIILKNTFRAISIPVLLAGLVGISHADDVCYENCPVGTVTYKVDTYEDNQHFCGYDVEGNPQVCANAQVVQVDTTKITRTPRAGTLKLNAETVSDVNYASKISFGEEM
jgi:hypothetical protein